MTSGHLSIAAVLRRYYAVSLVYALAGGVLVGVYPLFLRSRGLTQLEMNSLLAVYFLVTFLTDVPTGALADTLGRRTSFALGCALRSFAFAFYFLAHSYVLFLVAEAIDAVGTAFCNGAVDAWGVDALDTAGFEGAKDGVLCRTSQLASLGFMTSGVIGALVADVDLAWPWLLGATAFLVAGVASALMREPTREARTLDVAAALAALTVRAGKGIRRGLAVRTVLLLSLAEAIVLGAWAPYWLEWPLLFKDAVGTGVWVVGWIACAFTGSRVIGAEIAARTTGAPSTRPRRLAALVVAAGMLLAVAGAVAARPSQAMIALALMSVCLGAHEPLALAWFNEDLPPEERATMLSFRSTMATAGAVVGLLLGGYVTDLRGIPFQWRIAGTIALLAAPCYLALARRAGEPARLNAGM